MIPDILDRFRMFPIGIRADIEKAFLMQSVAPKDRDFLRFFSREILQFWEYIIWNLDNDVLKCCADIEPLICEVRITKRLILSVVQKIFDPIGLLTPTILFPKLLLPNLWKLKISWDYELPPSCKKEFLVWFKDTSVLKNTNIPRHLKVNISSELHVFVVAVRGAYAACVFVRSIIDSKVNIVLARAKSWVAPLKPLSIPRLELMAYNVEVG
ncbi:integrase catalytic domain-containing protein [Trichonephila clavipes]|nr:integrase catalytic domain-containing protein [Trichonephila clavipes]